MKTKDKIYVIGHKNPDSDSILSAIAYANLKNRLNTNQDTEFQAACLGEPNNETKFVLKTFGLKEPEVIDNVKTQVKDIQINFNPSIKEEISLKKAWEIMQDSGVVTLPVTDEDEKLKGLVTTGDITKSYMNVSDNGILAEAKTSIKNIIDTIDGKLVCGDENKIFDCGKVNIAAGDSDYMKMNIGDNDLVILGNRKEYQKKCIDLKASVLVVTGYDYVDDDIVNEAKEKGIVIIKTKLNTYMVAKLIGQSMPVRYFMSKGKLITFGMLDYIDEIKQVMSNNRFRDFPIVSSGGKYLGTITRRNLLNTNKKSVILVDHNEETQTVEGIEEANVLEIIDHHKIQTVRTLLPIYFRNEPLGSTATIVCKMYREKNVDIDKQMAGVLLSAIISDTLLFKSPTCTQIDIECAEYLEKIAGVNKEKYALDMFMAGSILKDKNTDEILHMDLKKFAIGEKTIAISQVTSVNIQELKELKDKYTIELDKFRENENVDLMYIMLTSIFEENSIVVCAGIGSYEFALTAFSNDIIDKNDENVLVVDKLLSRKKQMVPKITMAIE